MSARTMSLISPVTRQSFAEEGDRRLSTWPSETGSGGRTCESWSSWHLFCASCSIGPNCVLAIQISLSSWRVWLPWMMPRKTRSGETKHGSTSLFHNTTPEAILKQVHHVSRRNKTCNKTPTTIIRSAWSKCPLRGCRAPCLAAGEFNQVAERLADVSAANVLLSLPAELTDQERQQLLTEFNRGRSHILFYFELKLHHWSQPPWVLYKLAHFNEIEALDALEKCLESNDPHPEIVGLRSEPLATEIAEWVDGQKGLDELPELQALIIALRFAWTAERWVEAHKSVLNVSVTSVTLFNCAPHSFLLFPCCAVWDSRIRYVY